MKTLSQGIVLYIHSIVSQLFKTVSCYKGEQFCFILRKVPFQVILTTLSVGIFIFTCYTGNPPALQATPHSIDLVVGLVTQSYFSVSLFCAAIIIRVSVIHINRFCSRTLRFIRRSFSHVRLRFGSRDIFFIFTFITAFSFLWLYYLLTISASVMCHNSGHSVYIVYSICHFKTP